MGEMSNTSSESPAHYSFEEFRMMYQSTELVSDRKINFTRANSSLCMAMIAGQGVGGGWAYGKHDIELIAAITISVISILGVIFCSYWNAQLLAFKELNTAKFKVLEEMAAHVVFPDYKERTIRSMNPFLREYEILRQMKRLTVARGMQIQKSNFTEMIVPKSFLVFFAVTGVLCVYWTIRILLVAPNP
jgi:hypothetical protein